MLVEPSSQSEPATPSECTSSFFILPHSSAVFCLPRHCHIIPHHMPRRLVDCHIISHHMPRRLVDCHIISHHTPGRLVDYHIISHHTPRLLCAFSHTGIVRALAVCFKQQPAFIVTELMPGGDMLHYLIEHARALSSDTVVCIGGLRHVCHICTHSR